MQEFIFLNNPSLFIIACIWILYIVLINFNIVRVHTEKPKPNKEDDKLRAYFSDFYFRLMLIIGALFVLLVMAGLIIYVSKFTMDRGIDSGAILFLGLNLPIYFAIAYYCGRFTINQIREL
jgi:small-conductance mechanosensitive channel